MKYLHRTHAAPDAIIATAARWFGQRLSPTEEGPRRRAFAGTLGAVRITVDPEDGLHTRVTVATDQLAESELDKYAKEFLGQVHVLAHPTHPLRGEY
jgi:hypothetical protein